MEADATQVTNPMTKADPNSTLYQITQAQKESGAPKATTPFIEEGSDASEVAVTNAEEDGYAYYQAYYGIYAEPGQKRESNIAGKYNQVAVGYIYQLHNPEHYGKTQGDQ